MARCCGASRRSPSLQQIHSQIKLRHGIRRFEADGFLKKFFRVNFIAQIVQCFAKAIVSGIVVGGNVHGVRKNGQAVPPITQLDGSQDEARDKCQGGRQKRTFRFFAATMPEGR